jgi:hypothetical protein
MWGRSICTYECATDPHGERYIAYKYDLVLNVLNSRNQWPETYNLVFGRTVNPANRTLTCGGSSGGEGALLAMREPSRCWNRSWRVSR